MRRRRGKEKEAATLRPSVLPSPPNFLRRFRRKHRSGRAPFASGRLPLLSSPLRKGGRKTLRSTALSSPLRSTAALLSAPVRTGGGHVRRHGNPKHLLLEYLDAEGKRGRCSSASLFSDLPLSDGSFDPGLDDLHELRDWVRIGNENHASILEQRHHAEVEAFIEQMRQKEETLETYQRQVMGKALEIKMLQSHTEGLDRSLSHLREEDVKLEVLLLKREKEMELLKEQLSFHFQQHRRRNSSCSLSLGVCQQKALCSEVRLKERKTREKHKDSKPKSTGKFTDEINVCNTRLRQLGSNEESEIYEKGEGIYERVKFSSR